MAWRGRKGTRRKGKSGCRRSIREPRYGRTCCRQESDPPRAQARWLRRKTWRHMCRASGFFLPFPVKYSFLTTCWRGMWYDPGKILSRKELDPKIFWNKDLAAGLQRFPIPLAPYLAARVELAAWERAWAFCVSLKSRMSVHRNVDLFPGGGCRKTCGTQRDFAGHDVRGDPLV